MDEFRTLNWQKIKREVEESGIFQMFLKVEPQNYKEEDPKQEKNL